MLPSARFPDVHTDLVAYPALANSAQTADAQMIPPNPVHDIRANPPTTITAVAVQIATVETKRVVSMMPLSSFNLHV